MIFSAVATCLIVGFHVFATAASSKIFETQHNPYLIASYIIPLFWFIYIVNYLFGLDAQDILVHSSLYLVLSAIYFSAWYYMRNVSRSDDHFPLYFGGVFALLMTITTLRPELEAYNGVIIAIVSIIFGILYIMKPL